ASVSARTEARTSAWETSWADRVLAARPYRGPDQRAPTGQLRNVRSSKVAPPARVRFGWSLTAITTLGDSQFAPRFTGVFDGRRVRVIHATGRQSRPTRGLRDQTMCLC